MQQLPRVKNERAAVGSSSQQQPRVGLCRSSTAVQHTLARPPSRRSSRSDVHTRSQTKLLSPAAASSTPLSWWRWLVCDIMCL